MRLIKHSDNINTDSEPLPLVGACFTVDASRLHSLLGSNPSSTASSAGGSTNAPSANLKAGSSHC